MLCDLIVAPLEDTGVPALGMELSARSHVLSVAGWGVRKSASSCVTILTM